MANASRGIAAVPRFGTNTIEIAESLRLAGSLLAEVIPPLLLAAAPFHWPRREACWLSRPTGPSVVRQTPL